MSIEGEPVSIDKPFVFIEKQHLLTNWFFVRCKRTKSRLRSGRLRRLGFVRETDTIDVGSRIVHVEMGIVHVEPDTIQVQNDTIKVEIKNHKIEPIQISVLPRIS